MRHFIDTLENTIIRACYFTAENYRNSVESQIKHLSDTKTRFPKCRTALKRTRAVSLVPDSDVTIPGDPASFHKAGRVSSPLADGRVAPRAAAGSAVTVRVVGTVSLPRWCIVDSEKGNWLKSN